VPAALPDPATATVSPITEEVLAAVHLALVQQTASGVAHDQRTRATAYLARVHHEALLQLGSGGDEPLSPFARVLAGRFVHWGRELCRMYWQRRVAGLEGLFTSTEAQLMRTVAALERTPHADDDALLAVERQRARRHLQGAGVKERVTKAGAPSPTSLLPLPHEFDRLLDQGFVELAIQRALFLGGEVGGFGVATMADMLRGELTRRDLTAYAATLERRIAEARALVPAPPEQGKPLPGRVALTWPGDQVTADAAQGWLTIGGGPRRGSRAGTRSRARCCCWRIGPTRRGCCWPACWPRRRGTRGRSGWCSTCCVCKRRRAWRACACRRTRTRAATRATAGCSPARAATRAWSRAEPRAW
jgi:hypothetical protein